VFREHEVCECAGEHLPVTNDTVRLTAEVSSAGCASKIPRSDLMAALSGLSTFQDPRIIIGSDTVDDAGVIELDPGMGTVLTVDVFAPVVDDPYDFGCIAAANSVSDIYAMGAKPEVALSIIAFPSHRLPLSAMRAILEGGAATLAKLGIPVIGGHSIKSEEILFGYSVHGRAPLSTIVANRGAKPGDVLVLSKALGTGIIAFANQLGRAEEAERLAALESMRQVNRIAGEAMVRFGAHAGTDVTGFSLLGHLLEMARGSAVTIALDFDSLPLLPGVERLARQEVLPGATIKNRSSVPAEYLDLSSLAPAQIEVCFGPETSGGILCALPQNQVDAYVLCCKNSGIQTWVIGTVDGPHSNGLIQVTSKRKDAWMNLPLTKISATDSCCDAAPEVSAEASCCCSEKTPCCSGDTPGALPAPANLEGFGAFLSTATQGGAIDAKHKALMAYALSIAGRCTGCITIQASKARAAGATDAMLAEAAALGIAFGGAPASMHYHEMIKESIR
jgi:selenide,water dikinase